MSCPASSSLIPVAKSLVIAAGRAIIVDAQTRRAAEREAQIVRRMTTSVVTYNLLWIFRKTVKIYTRAEAEAFVDAPREIKLNWAGLCIPKDDYDDNFRQWPYAYVRLEEYGQTFLNVATVTKDDVLYLCMTDAETVQKYTNSSIVT